MSMLESLQNLLKESKEEYEAIMAADFKEAEAVGSTPAGNIMAMGDNLSFMKYLAENKDMAGKIQLIYIDPPFFSKTNYGTEIKLSSENIKKIPAVKQFAYHDVWQEGLYDYLKMLSVRFFMMKDLLSEEGCLWVHLDWHAVHYVKIILDEIFGPKSFVNEVVWNYKSGGSSKRRFARKHDTLLFYAKSDKYYFNPLQEKSYNRGFKPYRFKGVKEYRDEMGWYTMVNMKDVWQIDMVGRTSAERTGYVTQKPEALLARIIESCTREGDICADFFGGSGTLAATADKLGRKWIYCDLGGLAVVNAQKRLSETKSSFTLLEQENLREISERSGCEAEIIAMCEPMELTDKMLLTVELKSYRPADLTKIPVANEHIKVIEKIIKEDSLQLVDYWSIDYNCSEAVHKAEEIMTKSKGEIPYKAQKIGKDFDKISIRIVDIFGNSSVKKIKVGVVR